MPIAPRSNPFTQAGPPVATTGHTPALKLRIPQVRVLTALAPEDWESPTIDWPTLSRVGIAMRSGTSTISDLITRALNGLHPKKHPDKSYLGLLALDYVVSIELDIDGKSEVYYQLTEAGALYLREHTAMYGKLKPPKPREVCLNSKYQEANVELL
jgi:hypothetical protein